MVTICALFYCEQHLFFFVHKSVLWPLYTMMCCKQRATHYTAQKCDTSPISVVIFFKSCLLAKKKKNCLWQKRTISTALKSLLCMVKWKLSLRLSVAYTKQYSGYSIRNEQLRLRPQCPKSKKHAICFKFLKCF